MALLTRRDSQTTRSGRVSLRVVAPMVALAAAGLTACAPPNEEPSTVAGTTPAVWTGMPAPEGHGEEGHGSEAEGHGATSRINVVLQGADGKAAGTATFVGDGSAVVVTVAAQGLQPGFHGLRIHSAGVCEGDFASTGAPLQVEGNAATGELPTLFAREDGSANLTATTDAFTIEDLQNNGEGTALVVLDTAAAGAPVVCGVVK